MESGKSVTQFPIGLVVKIRDISLGLAHALPSPDAFSFVSNDIKDMLSTFWNANFPAKKIGHGVAMPTALGLLVLPTS